MLSLDFQEGSILMMVLLALMAAAVLFQLLFHWLFFSRLAFHKQKERSQAKPPVSVIIAARNEYLNLKLFLPQILEQDYPEFEVVVVNDASDDDTNELLKDFSIKHPHLKVVNFARNLNFFRGKKFPLSLGIKSAAHDILIFTDADCRPASRSWISLMASRFNHQVDIVLGYGAYDQAKGLLNALIRYDTFHVAMQYLSFSLMGLTYMGVGRNLAYRKSLFYKHKGFTSHYRIPSGDDDLFINRAADSRNTVIEINPESFTISRPVKGWLRFFMQKRRHLTTAKYYKWKFKILLTAYSVSQFFTWFLFFALIFTKFNLFYVLMLMGVKLISQLTITYFCSNKLKEEKLLLFSPLIELIFVVLNPLIAISNLIYKTDKWK